MSYVNDGSGTSFSNSTSPQFVGTGETFSTSSSLQLGGDGNNGTAGDEQTSTTTLDFSAVDGSGFSFEVEDVSFRINDFDTSSWIDVVTVRAYDANGNLLDVTLTWNGTALTSTNATLTSNVANGSAATETGSILVEIAGPVASIEIDYVNNGTGGQALWVTDVQFNAIDLDGTVEGSSGDDVIDDTYILEPDGDKVDADDEILPGFGADGDLIEAYGGDDSILAGAGDDEVYGGDGADTIDGGTGDDTLYGGNTDEVSDLIVNRSFEDLTGTVDTSWGDQGTGSIFGWTDYNGGELDLHDNGKGGTFATDGTHVLDMGGTPDNVHVYQDISGAVSGETYSLKLDAGDVTGGGNSIEIYWGGDLIATIDPVEGGMESFQFDLIGGAGDGANRLEFKEIGPIDPDGVQLDNIQLIGPDGNAASQDTSGDVIDGGAGDDTIYGLDGDDTAQGGDDNDIVYGGAGDDTLDGNDGNDDVYGGTGDDTFNVSAGEGIDIITGGEDSDGLDVDTLGFTDATGPDGVDVTMSGDEAGSYAFPTDGGSGTFSEIEEFTLTDQDDDFDGVAATGGNTVDGGAGDDVLVGSSGSDSFTGGTGDDTLNANAGDDALDGGTGNDVIFGDEGEDVITGGADNDSLYGGQDNDDLYGGDGDDIVEGGDGDDTLYGGAGADTLTGGADQDVIYDGAGDVVNGSGSGVDYDTLIVSDVDYIDYDTDPENGIVYFNGGGSLTFTDIENVVVSDRDFTVSGTAGDDTINSGYTGDPDGDQVDDTDAIIIGHEPNDDLIEAGAGNDVITSGAGDDTIYAGTGNDTVMAGTGTGNDTVFGGEGDDEMSAGIGTDTLYGGDGNDTFQFSDSDGTNTVVGSEGDDTGLGDILNTNAPSDVTITSAGDEGGTMTQGTTTVEFSEIEFIQTDSGNDTVDISNDTTGMTVLTYEGNDTVYGGSGGDNLNGLGGMIRWMATVVLTLLRVGPAMIQSSLPKATPRQVARATICSCSKTLAKPPTEPSQLMVGQATKPSAVAIRCNSATLVF